MKNSGSIHTINPFYTHEKSFVQLYWTYPLFNEELIDKHARKLCTQLKNGKLLPLLSLFFFLSFSHTLSLSLIWYRTSLPDTSCMWWNELKDYVENFILTKWPTKHILPDDKHRMHTYIIKYEIGIFKKISSHKFIQMKNTLNKCAVTMPSLKRWHPHYRWNGNFEIC